MDSFGLWRAGTTRVVAAHAPGTTLVVDIRALVQAYVNLRASTVDLRMRLFNEQELSAGNFDELTPGTIVLQVTYLP